MQWNIQTKLGITKWKILWFCVVNYTTDIGNVRSETTRTGGKKEIVSFIGNLLVQVHVSTRKHHSKVYYPTIIFTPSTGFVKSVILNF